MLQVYFPKIGEAKKMNVNFEYSKTLAGEASILLLLSIIPYVGWILGIIGIVLLLNAMKELSNYYQDQEIYQNSLTGVKHYIIALIASGAAIASIVVGIGTATGFTFKGSFLTTVNFGVGVAAFLIGIIIAVVFYVLGASYLRRTFNTLAQKSEEPSFATAGTLLWWGAVLTIILVGLILILIAWIFAIIGFFRMKSQQHQQYQQYNPQQNSYTQPPTQPEQAKPIENKSTEKKHLPPNNIMEIVL